MKIMLKKILLFSVFILLLHSVFNPMVMSVEITKNEGFDKGPSTKPVVPLKKMMMIGYDEERYLDDYAFMAGVPASIFKHQNKLFSNPLLYYQDFYNIEEDKERTLNARPGIDYFMEDWMGYCNGKMDQFTVINVPQNKIPDEWDAKTTTYLQNDNIYNLASEIALQEWSYSDNVIISPAEEKPKKNTISYTGETNGTIPSNYYVEQQTLSMQEPEVGIGGNYKSFEVRPPAKFIVANLYWDNLLLDYDLQLYDEQLGMAGANSKWNVLYDKKDGVPNEPIGTYIYNYGTWEAGITYMPTQSTVPDGKMKSMYQNVDMQTGMLSKITGNNAKMLPVDIHLYPGVEVEIPDNIPYGCRDVEFTLHWNNEHVRLGFFILDPSGAETTSAPDADTIIQGIEKGKTKRTIHLKALGETDDKEQYHICVFTLDNLTEDMDFTVTYNWQQNITRKEGDFLASASEGAILASQLNAPLLYVADDHVPQITKDTLYTLGVNHIHFVNLQNHVQHKVKQDLEMIANVQEYTTYSKIYDTIKEKSGSNDVIFSTVDPWSYFYGDVNQPVGEKPGSLFIGPSTYIAAHHESPLLIVDNHPTLSQATVWHTQFWRETARFVNRPHLPTVSCMVLTGRRVIDFLKDYGYDLPKHKDNLPTMITVAGQYDIGLPWDRTFTGRLIPGRFCFSPVDTAYQISRSVFYPALIFENPAMNGKVKLINGSKSITQPYIGKLRPPFRTDLVITRESGEEFYQHPVLHTYNVYQYKFNEIAPKAWGGKYTTATGITPGETPSNFPIDQGVVEGKIASYYPDIHESVVTGIYATKAGYSNCYSTNFETMIHNLNKGVLMWMESCHGHDADFGGLSIWNPDSPYVFEDNPWRAYDRVFAGIRNWKELGNYFSEGYAFASAFPPAIQNIMGIILKVTGFIPNILVPDVASTENPDAESSNPYIAEIPGIGGVLFDAFHWAPAQNVPLSRILSKIPLLGRPFRVYGDGTVIDASVAGGDVLTTYNGTEFDDHLDNLHSMGLNSVSCLTAGTYWQQSMVRHGCAYSIVDPWTTSWYSSLWLQNIPRELALGYTIGEAYEHGMELVGAEYLIDQWWWDLNENVLYFGDPNLRVYTPSTEYSDNNYWTKEETLPLDYDPDLIIHGHAIFGATSHPNEMEPKTILNEYGIVIIAIIAIIILLLVAIYYPNKK